MDALHIIESIYSNKPYKETCDVALKSSCIPFDYSFSRVPIVNSVLNHLEFKPYELTFDLYKDILSRVNLNVYNVIPTSLGLFSKPEEFDLCITQYSDCKGSIMEPLKITDLLFEDKNSNPYLSPLGILAFLFRKCYGNEDFRKYINSTILKEYHKNKLNFNRTVYTINDDENIQLIEGLYKHLTGENIWDKVSDILIQSPYIYIWRD